MIKSVLILSTLLFMSCGHKHYSKKHAHSYSHHKLMKYAHGEHRSESNKARNVYRNPVETLGFFEVAPDMKVVEISPGGGWYTEILGPYLKKKGELTLAIFDDNSDVDYRVRLNKEIRKKVSDKKLYGDVKFTNFDVPTAMGPIAESNSVDRVLTFRNSHGFLREGKAKEAFENFYDALKPGGLLGVVQHREKADRKQDPKVKSGYVKEDVLISLIESAGFEFVAKSEVNANYLDDSDHPEGVWTLPPSLRLKDKDRAKYLSIGESDRMTLKFRKPVSKKD